MTTQRSEVKGKAGNEFGKDVDLRDKINNRLASLKVVEALLMECLKCCQEQGIKFIGEWNITFFEAILDSITSFIGDIEQIVAE